MSSCGVHSVLNCIVCSVMNILSDVGKGDDDVMNYIRHHVEHGKVIDTFTWMPGEWLLPLGKPSTTHSVLISKADEEFDPTNIMMRIEPLIGNANRSNEVFKILNDTLATLYSLEARIAYQSCMPANFTFFSKEFARYAEEALSNPEVAQILREQCESAERIRSKEPVLD